MRNATCEGESATNHELTLLIADDHQIVRDGLRLLAEREGLKTIGEAENGRALVSKVLELKPSIVITDMAMPDLNGIEAVRQLRAARYGGVIIMFSMHADRRNVGDALKAGVNGYVLKHHAFEQMMEAIKAALHGKIWLSPQLSKVAVRGQVPSLIDLLTPREREVFQLLAEGHQTKEVAFRLEVSPKTIETHRLSLLSKLKADGIADLIRMAIRESLVKL